MNRLYCCLLIAVLLGGLNAGAVWAADTTTTETTTESHTHAPEQKGGIMDIKCDLGIWTAVIFGLLLLILSRTAWPQILTGLQKREETILTAREEALKARDEAQQYLAQVQAEVEKARTDAVAIMNDARRDAAKLREEEKARTLVELQQERERANREIETARDQALQDIYGQAVQLASLAATKAIRKELSLSQDEQRRLVDEAVGDLHSQLATGAKA